MSSFLSCDERGSGPPMVCLHGFGASTYTWRDVMDVLSATHTVYALDLKGFGQSPKPRDGRYSVHDQAALVLEFIAERGLTGVTLVGHSFGGGVALATALELQTRGPGALAALVLIDSAAYPQRFPLFIQVLRVPLFGAIIGNVLPAETAVRLVLKVAYHDDSRIPQDSVEAYAAALRERGGRYALRQTAKQILPDDIDDLNRRYPGIGVPTLLLWGKQDAIVPLAISERLRHDLPDANLVVIDETGHMPHEETPAPVRQALRAFLEAQVHGAPAMTR